MSAWHALMFLAWSEADTLQWSTRTVVATEAKLPRDLTVFLPIAKFSFLGGGDQ